MAAAQHSFFRLTVFISCFMVLLHIPNTVNADSNSDWELITDRNGIIVHRKVSEDSKIAAFRGNTIIHEADPYAFVALMNDYKNYSNWLHFISSAEELKQDSALQRHLRLETLLPWPLKNREAVVKANVIHSPPLDSNAIDLVTIHLSNEPDFIEENPKYIRFPKLEGIFNFKWLSPTEVSVTYQLQLDPGGYIKPWLTNILLRDAPYFTLEKMKRAIKAPAYHGHTYDYLPLLQSYTDNEDDE